MNQMKLKMNRHPPPFYYTHMVLTPHCLPGSSISLMVTINPFILIFLDHATLTGCESSILTRSLAYSSPLNNFRVVIYGHKVINWTHHILESLFVTNI